VADIGVRFREYLLREKERKGTKQGAWLP